jgi:hypothetical protein
MLNEQFSGELDEIERHSYIEYLLIQIHEKQIKDDTNPPGLTVQGLVLKLMHLGINGVIPESRSVKHFIEKLTGKNFSTTQETYKSLYPIMLETLQNLLLLQKVESNFNYQDGNVYYKINQQKYSDSGYRNEIRYFIQRMDQ